jgi:hypothetical protein
VSPEGVNSEFWPFLRMTFPRGTTEITADWQSRNCLFRSWILFVGILPVEYDDIGFAEVESGCRFLEKSSMLTQRVWQHERIVEECTQGCRLTDRVHFESRLPFCEPVFRALFLAVFHWRHRRLRRLFGESAK